MNKQEEPLLNRIGISMFVVGLMLCLIPFVGRMLPKDSAEAGIGQLKIPVIQVELPIYESTEEEMLEQGVGHIKNSSLPGSGVDTHSLLAGHRGLPRAQLLERLGELKVGDFFQISIRGEECSYRVCEIRVILPKETETLGVQKGRELVSLITCTPYGIHTHRLVVTGERMK